ncbi:hypothetical protein [Stieleria tagensis]|uniref:hypothetical protein n=1 Tax=Stieleria tagensis TaxID=2956795 RepID=UPI00209B1A4F|nr:hypothetical protein [Stieleria tagensis]
MQVLSTALAPALLPAQSPGIQFDMPAITTALDCVHNEDHGGSATASTHGMREVSFDLVVSSLIVDAAGHLPQAAPPIDHLLIRCAMRDNWPVVDYSPRTELETDFASPITVTNKQERNKSYGISIDGQFPQIGAAHAGADDQDKRSDSTQFDRQAPMQAVVASGTTDRGRGVYFKLRWTAQHVLEGEKQFRVSIAVPHSWRGGLIDVSVIANGRDRALFGPTKIRALAISNFVVAVYRQGDSEAAEIALRLANLDRKLAALALEKESSSGAITQFWQHLLPNDSQSASQENWYRRLVVGHADPYTDKRIRSLPMAARVAVLDYTEASRELTQLGDAG